MSPLRARSRDLAIAVGFSLVLIAPAAVHAEEPILGPAFGAGSPVQHLMGSGGLGSRFAETILPAPAEAHPGSHHLMGSGGLGSRLEDTLLEAVGGEF